VLESERPEGIELVEPDALYRLGFHVPEGEHVVELSVGTTWPFWLGGLASLLSLAALVAAALCLLRAGAKERAELAAGPSEGSS